MPTPVRQFFRVTLQDPGEHLSFSQHALAACSTPKAMMAAATSDRPVVFQPLMPGAGDEAFVSTGAARLLREAGFRGPIDTTPIPLEQLPDGLALLLGDAADVEEYSKRR